LAAYCHYTTSIENLYWEKDTIMEGIIDNFIIIVDNTDSLDGDSDSYSDIEDMKSFISNFVWDRV
jgi:hypothetical protein